MKFIIGNIIVIVSIIGGYLMAHGKLGILWQPAEVVIIFGAAVGAFITTNPGKVLKATLAGLPKLLSGSPYNKQAYMEVLALMYELFTKARKEGLMSLEPHVEEPESSDLFNKYPSILKDHGAVEFICDYLRMIVGGNMNAMELENLMDAELDNHHHEADAPGAAVVTMGDGMPGFGIVAAVLGVIITMGSIGGSPAELGYHIAAALVGTFLGILLAYGFVGPMGNAMQAMAADEGKYLTCIKQCILATLNGYSPQVAVEFGRKVIDHADRPGFLELEEYVKQPR
ncbi:MAG: flagellar motor stator protein MotA [Gammaproteobacteria bacterium]|nr:flagellar motor stator protein MotA [Gammaproteobacteria bacterium]